MKSMLKCPDCGAPDGNYTVSRNDEGCIIFQCNSCKPDTMHSLCAIASCTVGDMLTMFDDDQPIGISVSTIYGSVRLRFTEYGKELYDALVPEYARQYDDDYIITMGTTTLEAMLQQSDVDHTRAITRPIKYQPETPIDELDMSQETLDVLNDPDLLQQMADSEEDYKAGRCVPLHDIIAELEDN